MKYLLSACRLALVIGFLACVGMASAAQSLYFYDHLDADHLFGQQPQAYEWTDQMYVIDPTTADLLGGEGFDVIGVPWNRVYQARSAPQGSSILFTLDGAGKLLLLDLEGNFCIWREDHSAIALPVGSELSKASPTPGYACMTYGGGYVWVLLNFTSFNTAKLVRLDISGGPAVPAVETVTTLTFPNVAFLQTWQGLAYGNNTLWIFEPNGNGSLSERMWEVDATTRSVRGSAHAVSFYPLGPPAGMQAADHPVGSGLAYMNSQLYLLDTNGTTGWNPGQGILWTINPATYGTSAPVKLNWASTITPGGLGSRLLPVGMAAGPQLPQISLTVTDSAAAEAGQDPGRISINRLRSVFGTGRGPTASIPAVSVPFTLGGTAVSGDYALLSDINQPMTSPVTLGSGAGAAVGVVVKPVDDALIEPTETVILTVTAGAGFSIDGPTSATVSIVDNDVVTKPIVTIAATDAAAAEAGLDPGTFRVSLNVTVGTDTVVALGTPTGNATSNVDYVPLPTSVTILANTLSANVTLTPKDDAVYEGNETVTLGLLAGSSYTLGSPSAATVTIADNEKPTVTVTASDAIAAEGGGNDGTFTFSRGVAIGPNLPIAYTMGGTATSGSDYTALSGTATILSGTASVTVTLSPIDDAIAELSETAILTITPNVASYVVGSPGAATVTIKDNEAPVVTITASDPSAKEGGTDQGSFTITRLGQNSAALTINLGKAGTATAGSDYTAIAATVGIAIDGNTVVVPVTVLEDSVVEDDETVIVTVTAGTGYTVGTPSSATVTIGDNETPVLTITATDNTAAEAGVSTGTFTIKRQGDKAPALTVNVDTVGSTATSATDYTAIAATQSLAANTVTKTITVTPVDDAAMEPSETVVCNLKAGTGYTVGTPASATVTIADNDTQTVTITASLPNAAEPATNGAFVVKRTGPTGASLTVAYTIATGVGKATNGADFATIPTTVTIAAGNTDSATIPITVTDDSAYEGPEMVTLTISANPTLYVVGSPATATVNIADNDKPTVTVTALDASAAEPSDTGTYRISRSGITSLGLLTVKYTMGNLAINGTDYTLLSGTVDIPVNVPTVDVTLTPTPDTLIEGPEAATMTISANANYNVGSPSTATVTIGASIIDTIAGKGPAFIHRPTEGVQATTTTLILPTGIAIDAAGNRYIADSDPNTDIAAWGTANAIWVVNASGVLTRFAGNASGTPGFAGDGGAATAASLNCPQGVAVDASGNVFIADTLNRRVRKVTSAGVISTVAGGGSGRTGNGDGGPATAGALKNPVAIGIDGAGNLYIVDSTDNRVRKVTASTGIITTIAGSGTAGPAGDGGAATAAQLLAPMGIDLDAAGNLYIADTNNHRVRKVTVSTGIITTIAGNGTPGSAGDGGSPTAAQLNAPQGVAISDAGEIFIADTAGNRVRKIEGSTIITVAGNGTPDFAGDGGPGPAASLNLPTSLAFDTAGNLHIADSYNSAIRRLRAGVTAVGMRVGEAVGPVLAGLRASGLPRWNP